MCLCSHNNNTLKIPLSESYEFSSYLPVKVGNCLKNRLIFILFLLYLNVCKQTFHVSHVRISQNVKCILLRNLRYIIFMRRRRCWRIFKSALVYQLQDATAQMSLIRITNSSRMSWKYWIMIDYSEKKFLDENRRFDRIKSIDWYRLVNIADINRLDDLTC